MTVSTTTRRVAYNGNGSTTVFAVPFVFFGASELQVIARDSDGVETVQALSTNYTVSGGNGSTGAVTAVVAPPSGTSWTIIRQTARTQLTDYVPNDPFPAQTHERALDRLTAIAQEIEDGVANALTFPVTEPGPYVLPSRTARANRFISFDNSGNLLLVTNPGGGGLGYRVLSSSATGYGLTVANTSPAAGRPWVRFSAGVLVTIPTHAEQAIPVGTEVFFGVTASNVTGGTIATAPGVTLNGFALPDDPASGDRYAEFSGEGFRVHLVKLTETEWWGSGFVVCAIGLDGPIDCRSYL